MLLSILKLDCLPAIVNVSCGSRSISALIVLPITSDTWYSASNNDVNPTGIFWSITVDTW